jgi:hypothetical protein
VSPRRGGEPRRRVSRTAGRRSLLVFTEGLKTEPIYLNHWHRVYREQVIVTIDGFHGAPLQLVQKTAERRSTDLREQRRGRGDAYSDYWCVFDIDEHPHVEQALELAEESGINVASSNPCIELWFLLHFQDQHAVIDRGTAQRRARDLLGFDKVPTPDGLAKLQGLYEEARRRAQHLDKKHELDGSPSGSNPSSGVWCLIDKICNPGPNDLEQYVRR